MVYNRLRKLVHEEWKTKINTVTNEKGTVAFRGFYGKYAITLETKEGKTRSFDAVLWRDQENEWIFSVEE